jgi:hypothetical protein
MRIILYELQENLRGLAGFATVFFLGRQQCLTAM